MLTMVITDLIDLVPAAYVDLRSMSPTELNKPSTSDRREVLSSHYCAVLVE